MELLGKFFSFIGAILEFFWKGFFEQSGQYFTRVWEAPGSSFFEIAICAFLIGIAAFIVVGIGRSIIKVSPVPFITTVELYNRFFAHVGAWIIIVLIFAMVYEVLARYLFDAPTQWAFEMAYMLMGTSFMFGIGYCLQMKRHIRVDFLYDNVGDRGRAIIDLVGYTLLVPMAIWLTGGLWEYFNEAYRVQETSGESAWNPIIWPFKFTFVIGFLLLLSQIIVECLKAVMILLGREVPEPPPVESVE